MTVLDVHLEGSGMVGTLTSDERLALAFRYVDGYAGAALSIYLPVQSEPYDDIASRAFFHGLLQEGWRLDKVAATHRIDRNDTVGLLTHLGRECAGAISVVPQGHPPGRMPGDLDAHYVEISPAQLALDVADLYARKPPRRRMEFSLAGVQSKMAVTVHPDGRILEPLDGAPTTHIIKVGNAEDQVLVENELLCMKTAARLGLPVVDCEMRRAGAIPYLLVPRFDRVVDGNLVRRIHQEDLCQALGLPITMKYEKDRDPADPARAASFANLFALDRKTADPVGFTDALIRITFFNFLVGNADAHAKNFAFLHGGRKPVLAKFYDLVCIALYESASQEFALEIGGAKMWDDVGLDQWLAFLDAAGIKGKGRNRVIERLLRPMATAILPAMESELGALGLRESRASIILDCVGERIRHLNSTLDWAIKVDTDTFVVSGGGWQLS